MKMKKVLWLLLIITLILGSGITYSVFSSDANISGKQNIAKFIFNAEEQDSIELPLSDIYPGVTKEYQFSVSNNSSGKVSNVTLNYELTIKTFHFMPLLIELYKVNTDEARELIISCDETHTRDNNSLVCNAPTEEMNYDTMEIDNYVLKIEFPSIYSEEVYTNLVDYIDIEINSWQKIGK